MTIDISRHYFHAYEKMTELRELNGFKVGEIVTDWEGISGCILCIFKDGGIKLDSNGNGHISEIKKLRSKKKIAAYLADLLDAEIRLAQSKYEGEMRELL